ncbi:ATP-binding cassette subfamily C protein EexD [Pseudomonas sp. SORGH_AS199]|uniref:type I secretion system permease/ATPase n=1 Tax=Pseudomonas sp. SORGH_AS_0199 TaxID=3041761 RepID=UPI002859816B|nr:type I secretion system permease/ATPase [Pseudomonas sp. SORGH_AS_0199]MDR6227980.1 ATP-binding cassette subfamily C protein EexD [Pseudomonas sp. SORGH_AS_0199]
MQSKPKTDLEQALIACKGSFLTVGFFSLFINLLLLVPSFYMLQVYDRVLSSSSITTLVMLTLIMLLLMATYGALEWIRSRILVRVSTRLDLVLNERLYDASFKQALYTGGAQASAQPLNDLTGLRQFLTGQGLFAFFDAPWLPIYIAVMYFFHPLFGALTVLGAILLILLAYANEKLTGKRLAEANQENAQATQFTSKNLRNAEVVASMGMMPNLFKQWRKRNTHVLALQARASEHGGALSNLSKTLRMVLQSLILGLGAWLVIDHQITPGLMTAGSLLLGRALAPIDLMIGSWKGFIAARGQYARLNEMMRHVQAEPPRMSLPAPKGNISVEQLILTPPGAFQAVLKGISFNVTAGASVGILGASAAGKSTLARALLGIWPAQSGKVRLDGADIAQWKREELGPYIGYLPQDIELFDGSISDNIARFGQVDAKAVVEAAELAGVHEMILRLPQGYDTIIGANSGVLSGGQRQRIGLARAVYGNPRLVVLDEPNSNLDELGEKALGGALLRLKQTGATLFIVTHRVSVLAYVDNLIVMNEGQIVMSGQRDQVLAQLQGRNAATPVAAAETESLPKTDDAGEQSGGMA